MKKLVSLLLTFALVVSLAGCVGEELPTEVKEVEEAVTEAVTETTEAVEEAAEEVMAELVLAPELKLNVALGNNARTITYNQATPLTLPDGSVVSQGELKPTWSYFQDQLGFDIIDTAVQDQKATEMIDIAAALSFSEATVYGGNSIAEKLMNYGALGYFINLKDYLDYMPEFKAYLEANPNIANAITAYDGGIYHIPYAAELGNYARTFNVREAWVTGLLDSADALVDESATLEVAYEAYWDSRNATNVVDLQNQAAGGTLSREVALTTLVDYIAATYPSLEKPSDLFLGETAMYDMDELVALLRVVKLSPNTLSKLSTGDVVDGAIITPYFVRQSKYRDDLLRLVTYFGGQRVFGSDSYGSRFYLDSDGELNFSFNDDGFLEGIDQLKAMYAEGLIHTEFSDESNKDNFRKVLYSNDETEAHQEFGFMTGDWIASTTVANADVISVLPPVTTISGSGDEFVHFIENTRVIKPDGWAISSASSEEEINSALKLFNFFFTEEGIVAQNYGTPDMVVDGELFVAANGVEYPKFEQWIFDAAAEYKNGDVSGFLRDFVGSQIPIGYQKQIGFELQYTANKGPASWALYTGQDVKSTSYEEADPAFRLVPPVFSMTEQDLAKIGTLAVGDDQVDQIFLYIVSASGAVSSSDEIKAMYDDAGIDAWVDVYRSAYKRMTGE